MSAPLLYFFVLFFLRAVTAKDQEKLDSSGGVYYRLLASLLNYYVPLNDG